MDQDIGTWAKIIGIPMVAMTFITAVMKGIFITKSECGKQKAVCVKGIKEELSAIRRDLRCGTEKFENTERYIVAIASKLDIKSDDIPKL